MMIPYSGGEAPNLFLTPFSWGRGGLWVKGLIRDEGGSREFGRLGVWEFGKSGQTLVNTLVKLSNSGENFGIRPTFFGYKL